MVGKSIHWEYRTGLGQDHHAYVRSKMLQEPLQPDTSQQLDLEAKAELRAQRGEESEIQLEAQDQSRETGSKPGSILLLAGVPIPHETPFDANSDGDILLHALTNACSSLSGVPFLGPPADALCRSGIRDSRVYFEEAWKTLQEVHSGVQCVHVAISIEALRPKLYEYIPALRQAVAKLLQLPLESVGITATTGEGLTGMGQGKGMAVLAMLTVRIPHSEPGYADPV